jgi:MFS family permease
MEKITAKIQPKQKILKLFPAFRHRNYRYYFLGQLVSMMGTWLQAVAQGWLVWQLTNSAYMVGVIAALGFLPTLLFGIFGGVMVDWFNRKKLIQATQLLSMILALTLGVLTILGFVNLWVVGLFAFLLGIVNAIDMPARQAFTIELVGQDHLPSAIALNMGTFNTARVIGPAIAGLLIAFFGTGPAFILNGLSFIGPLIALHRIKVQPTEITRTHNNPLLSIWNGMKYTFSHKYIRNLLLFSAITSIFGWSYATILPVIAQNVFHKDASGLGMLYSAAGVGAIVGTVFISYYHSKFQVDKLILGGSFTFIIAIALFSIVENFILALPLLFFAGLGLSVQMAMINSTIQFHVKHNLRGRVMGLYSLFFVGMQPIGSFQVGLLTEYYGPHFAIGYGAIIIVLAALIMFFTLPKLHQKAMLHHSVS